MSQEALKEALGKTIEAITKNPVCANAVFRAQTELCDGVCCSIKVRDFETVLVDEPAELGGTNKAMNPVEMVLGALGTCQEIMYAAYAAVMGIPLTKVKVDIKGHIDLRGLFAMDDTAFPGFKKITYETSIESPADRETLQKLVDMVESHCPVYDTLVRPVEVKGEVTINGTKK
ncbi:MAG: OsmC family protein [Alphaproteobacteria bacterium]|uniref:OsmC family protein n=1 Tax=Candidatus Nitrobium versatile TaxID=2884831 RepID=A0A953JAN4_9BACT|nr:OsmC family protein [Candidatus Nitrobium versatile]